MRTHSTDEKRRTDQARTGWTEAETVALIGLYDLMLWNEANGSLGRAKGQTSKATLIRQFIDTVTPQRSKGSVEAKLMNLSACRQELGLTLVTGYKALPNMSSSCRDIATRYWG